MSAGLEVDFAKALARTPTLELDLHDVDEAERAAAREHWRIHMAAEFASSRVFSGLVPELMAAGLDYDHVRSAVEMARQEVEHGLASARVHAALGGEPSTDLPPLPPVPTHEGVSPLEAVIRNVLSVSCCGETLAVAVIGGERERAASEPLREVLTSILADEVGHARFGWRLLGEVSTALDASTRARLAAYLVVVFERDIRAMRGAMTACGATDAALGLGAPDGPTMWATFWETMTEVTVPGLERHGLAAQRAWKEAIARVTGRGAPSATPSAIPGG